MGNVEIVTIIGIVGTLCSIVFGYIGYHKGTKKESHINGGYRGVIKSDIQYIKKMLEKMSDLPERITRVEESAKQAHKRLDGIERRRKINEAV